jgi:hypothetical protein
MLLNGRTIQARKIGKYLVGFEVFTAVVIKVAIFWSIAPCSPYVNGSFGFSTLKMEAICTPEASIHIRTTRRYTPEDDKHSFGRKL